MSCKYNNCKICGYKSECEIYKENVELKEELRKESEIISCDSSCHDNLLEIQDNLTKAKELLKRCYENYIYLEPLRSEIEQFLNSEVEK